MGKDEEEGRGGMSFCVDVGCVNDRKPKLASPVWNGREKSGPRNETRGAGQKKDARLSSFSGALLPSPQEKAALIMDPVTASLSRFSS